MSWQIIISSDDCPQRENYYLYALGGDEPVKIYGCGYACTKQEECPIRVPSLRSNCGAKS